MGFCLSAQHWGERDAEHKRSRTNVLLLWLVFTTIVVILLLLLFLLSDCLVLVLLLVVLVVVVVVAVTAFGTFFFLCHALQSFMAMRNGKGYIICCFRRFDYLAEQIKYIDESFF